MFQKMYFGFSLNEDVAEDNQENILIPFLNSKYFRDAFYSSVDSKFRESGDIVASMHNPVQEISHAIEKTLDSLIDAYDELMSKPLNKSEHCDYVSIRDTILSKVKFYVSDEVDTFVFSIREIKKALYDFKINNFFMTL